MLGSIFGHQVSDTLIEDLAGSTSKLREATDCFLHATHDNRMQTKIVCFYEQVSTQVLNAVLHRSLASWFGRTNYIVSQLR